MSSDPEGKSSASLDKEDDNGHKGKPGSLGGSANFKNGNESHCAGEGSDGNVDKMDCNDISDHTGGPDKDSNGVGKVQEEKKSNQPSMKTIWRKEADVGITEYLSSHEGFTAITKQRYSDFHVNEVNAQGEVIHFTDESVPDPPKGEEQIDEKVAPACIPEEKIAEINNMLGISNKTSQENEIAEKSEDAEKTPKEVLIPVDGLEKQERTNIHLFIKTNYKKVVSSTKEVNGEKFIQVKSGTTDDRRNKNTPWGSWPKSQRYTYFVLYKENMNTMDAISKMAFKLRMKPAMFGYAGTKDKRGKTSQLVSVPEVPPHRLYSITKDDWAMKVGNFSFHHKQLKLGQLCGNRFKLVLRDISVSDEVVNKAVENLKIHGFINYYGMQRFGTTSVSTNSVGKALLQGNWSEAVNLILCPRSELQGEENLMNKALQEYKKNGNANEALIKLNECYRGSSLEAQLLKGISECDKNDLVGALNRLPRNMRTMYLHAYQSFIWNSIASRRIKEFGLRVLPGDLVRRRASSKEKLLEIENEIIDTEDSTAELEVAQEEIDDDDSKNKKNVNIHVLTAEEANSTDITEVLMPLPGHDILLPENEIKNWYVEMIEKDGLSLEKLNHKVKAYSVSGVYRCLLARPSDVSHAITYYNDASKPLVQSDKEKLKGEDVEKNKLEGLPGLENGKTLSSTQLGDTNLDVGTSESDQSTDQKEKKDGLKDENNTKDAHKSVDDMTKGRMKALILELILPSSCYATMALRELLKIDTSTQLNNMSDSTSTKMNKGYGRGSFDNRRGSFDNRRGGFDNRRGGFDNRRGGFDNRRGGFNDRRGGFGKRRGNFDKGRGSYGGQRKRGRF